MVLVVANVFLKDGKKEEFLESAKKCIDGTLKEEGNIFYDLNQNALDETRFTFVEGWTSREALDLHMTTDHFKAFGKALETLREKDAPLNIYDAKEIK